MLAIGIFVVRPELQMPALSRFVDGTGPVLAGKIFPFCFITIACGAVSGFHSLISSGTTPKMISRETHATQIGYGSMLLESFVAVMAMITSAGAISGRRRHIQMIATGTMGAANSTATTTAIPASSAGEPVSPPPNRSEKPADQLATPSAGATRKLQPLPGNTQDM